MPERAVGGKKGQLPTGAWRSMSDRDGALFIAAHGLEKVARRQLRGADVEEEEHEEFHRVRANSAPMVARKGIGQQLHHNTAQQVNQQPVDTHVMQQPAKVDTWAYEGCRPHERSNAADRVTIHVHDEVNNISRNFMCKRETLLREMKYFKAYLSDDCSLDDLDISVHCDVSIFKWLMEYIHADPNKAESKPVPEPTIAVSILISSDFLQMTRLVEESLAYVVEHIQEIIKLPIDLDCINKKLISRLAALFTLEDLDKVRDRKDKLVGALFLHKLQSILITKNDLGESVNVLFRCSLCGKLFTEQQKSWFACPQSPPFVTFHGESISQHIIDPKWDVAMYLAAQRQKRLSWKDIFWRVWALIHNDVCKVCGRHFSIAEIGHCSYHLSLPAFEVGSHVGAFPCCGTEVKRFAGNATRDTGCCTRYHVLSNQEQKELVMTVVAKHSDVLIPWGSREVAEGANSCYAAVQNPSDDDSDSCSTSSDGTFGPEWRKRSKWSSTANHPITFAEGDSLRQSLQGNPRVPPKPSLVPANPANPPQPAKYRKKRKNSKAASRPDPRDGNPGPSHEWWQRLGQKAKSAYQIDLQRDEDARRMQSLLSFLDKRRVDYGEKAPQKPEQKPTPAQLKRPQTTKRTMSAGLSKR
eukprot:TRINITY_DN42600_c0_g1_i1.p1 TRINITY_DN42600_c0_g1~~TRINITY_DN42600_c0_g1_i1.p1  ORF type:complete len:640 (+),score=101.66 TRINITY_DN42600_c0_g1_i1:74-1993(+)